MVAKVRATTGVQLPLHASTVVFALDNGDGTTEGLWGVGIVEDRPAVYCSCRYEGDDRMWRDRRSETFRLWGRNETTLAPGLLRDLSPGHLLWLRWPSARSANTLPCYTVHPPESLWGVRFRERERRRWAREFPEFREPHVLVQGSGDQTPAVSIIRLPTGATVREIDGGPVAPMGVVPLDSRSSLHVVATMQSREPGQKAYNSALDRLEDENCFDWDEDDVEVVVGTMGSDEVGFAWIMRAPAVWRP